MPDFQIPLTQHEMETLLSKNNEVRLLKLKELLVQIQTPLFAVLKDDFITEGGGGMVELADLTLSSVDFNIETRKGKVVIAYKLNRFFACAGEEIEKMKNDTLDVYLDLERNELIFSLFELPKG